MVVVAVLIFIFLTTPAEILIQVNEIYSSLQLSKDKSAGINVGLGISQEFEALYIFLIGRIVQASLGGIPSKSIAQVNYATPLTHGSDSCVPP